MFDMTFLENAENRKLKFSVHVVESYSYFRKVERHNLRLTYDRMMSGNFKSSGILVDGSGNLADIIKSSGAGESRSGAGAAGLDDSLLSLDADAKSVASSSSPEKPEKQHTSPAKSQPGTGDAVLGMGSESPQAKPPGSPKNVVQKGKLHKGKNSPAKPRKEAKKIFSGNNKGKAGA